MPSVSRGGADGDHFGMGGRVERAAHGVARLGDDRVAAGDHRADRHFAGRGGLGGKVERAAHRRREAGKLMAAALAAGRPRCQQPTGALAGAAWFCTGAAGRRLRSPAGLTCSAGTLTSASRVPTATEPVSMSKAGAWPPVAVTPLRLASMSGALAPRTWLMSMKPVATSGDDGDHGQDEDKEDGSHALAPDCDWELEQRKTAGGFPPVPS